MSWHEQRPARWAGDQEIARQLMQEVAVAIDGTGRATITGTYPLTSVHGRVYDHFRLRIVYPENFPERNGHPEVYLESHRDQWQRSRDSHIESSWRLCLFVPLESGINFAKPTSLRDLFGAIHTFLIRERIYQRDWWREDITGAAPVWPGPQRSHGVKGLKEAIDAHGMLGRNDPCVCGSGQKFKLCCKKLLSKL